MNRIDVPNIVVHRFQFRHIHYTIKNEPFINGISFNFSQSERNAVDERFVFDGVVDVSKTNLSSTAFLSISPKEIERNAVDERFVISFNFSQSEFHKYHL